MQVIKRKPIEVSLIKNLKPGSMFITTSEKGKVSDAAQKAYEANSYFTHESYMLIGPSDSINKERAWDFGGPGGDKPITAFGLSDGLLWTFNYEDEVVAFNVSRLTGRSEEEEFLKSIQRHLGCILAQ